MIVDAHLDVAWNALAHGRGFEGPPAPGYLVSREALERAGIGLFFATLYCAPAARRGSGPRGFTYRSAREAGIMAFAQAGYYESVGLPLVRTREDLEGHLRSGGLAAVLLMEGADPVEDPADLRRWVERGVRIVGPAWAGTRYSGGTRAPGGLTELGHGLLRAMRRQRVVLDLSHMAEQAVRDAFAVWRGPVIASHSNARALLPGDRQVSDETAAEIGRRGGVIGVSFFQRHLTKRKQASLDDVARHVFHLATAAGGPEHVGIGSDLDGGFQATEAPLRDLSELAGLGPLLRRRLSATQVEGVLGGNWIEFLRRSLPA